MPKLSGRFKRVAFTLVFIAILAVVLEVGSAIALRFSQGYGGTHLLQYQYDAYKNVHPTPNYVDQRGIRHNAQGFRRDSDVSKDKPAGTYRIFLMGASTAYGLGGLWPHLQRDYAVIDNSETISAYLEEILSDSLPDQTIEVINAAISSVWVHHHLIYLNQQILSYDPDMILFLDGLNDHFKARKDHDQFASYAYLDHATIIMGDPTFKSLLYQNGWWLFRKSAFGHLAGRSLRTFKRILKRRPQQNPIDPNAHLANLREVFPNNALPIIERNARLLEAEDVRAVFMLQPLLILERERAQMPAAERELFEFNVDSYRPNYEQFMRLAVPFVADALGETVARYGAMFIDLTGIYADAEGQVFTDYAHLTPEANELLARYVSGRIVPWIRLDSGAAQVEAKKD